MLNYLNDIAGNPFRWTKKNLLKMAANVAAAQAIENTLNRIAYSKNNLSKKKAINTAAKKLKEMQEERSLFFDPAGREYFGIKNAYNGEISYFPIIIRGITTESGLNYQKKKNIKTLKETTIIEGFKDSTITIDAVILPYFEKVLDNDINDSYEGLNDKIKYINKFLKLTENNKPVPYWIIHPCRSSLKLKQTLFSSFSVSLSPERNYAEVTLIFTEYERKRVYKRKKSSTRTKNKICSFSEAGGGKISDICPKLRNKLWVAVRDYKKTHYQKDWDKVSEVYARCKSQSCIENGFVESSLAREAKNIVKDRDFGTTGSSYASNNSDIQ